MRTPSGRRLLRAAIRVPPPTRRGCRLSTPGVGACSPVGCELLHTRADAAITAAGDAALVATDAAHPAAGHASKGRVSAAPRGAASIRLGEHRRRPGAAGRGPEPVDQLRRVPLHAGGELGLQLPDL
jgi:hypothetical protein